MTIAGYATGDGNKGTFARVIQVSLDGGKSWKNATITHMENKAQDKKVFSWTLWKYDIDVSDLPVGEHTLSPMARVITSDGTI